MADRKYVRQLEFFYHSDTPRPSKSSRRQSSFDSATSLFNYDSEMKLLDSIRGNYEDMKTEICHTVSQMKASRRTLSMQQTDFAKQLEKVEQQQQKLLEAAKSNLQAFLRS